MKTHANRQTKQHEGGLHGMEAFSFSFPFLFFYNRLRSLHVDALNGAHPAKSVPVGTEVIGLQESDRPPPPPRPSTPPFHPMFGFHCVTPNCLQHARTLNMNAACNAQVPCVRSFK